MGSPFSDIVMKYNVKSIVGENCITFEDGEKIYEIVYSGLVNEQEIELDFTGVRIFASIFFNVAIGKLLSDFSSDYLNQMLHFGGLSAHGNQVLRRVIKNAQEFYSNPRHKEAVEKVISLHSEGC